MAVTHQLRNSVLETRAKLSGRQFPAAAHWLLFGVVMVLAAALRIVDLDKAGLRIDEGFTLMVTRQSWADVTGTNGYYDLHPPLFFTLTKAANLVLPETIAARTVAAIAGIATVPVFYALCRRLVDDRVALGATLVLALSPLHIEFSRDGRMYAPVLFFVTVGWLALISFMQTERRGWALLYGASLALAVYTDYSAIYALAPQGIVLAVYLARARRRAAWLAGAVAGAGLVYLPWLTQIYRSVSQAEEASGRQDWLGASWPRITDSVVSLLGFHGRTVTGGGDTPDIWARWPELHVPLMLLALPALGVGLWALRRRPAIVAIVLTMALAPPLAAIILSQISPGYAPRTIMAAVLGLSILVSGFLIRRPLPRIVRGAGAVGWGYLLAIAILTLPATYEVGTRSEWPEIAQDLASQRGLDKPILVFSTGGMLTDMLDLYAGDELANARIITLLDGPHDVALGYRRWLDRGPTLAEMENGVLAALLPTGDPTYDAIWMIRRFGGGKIPGYLNDLGYQQIGAIRYTDTTLFLYARPGAALGEAIPVDNTFRASADASTGWLFRDGHVQTRQGAPGSAGDDLVIVAEGGAASFQFAPGSGGLVTVELEAFAAADQARLVIECAAESGDILTRDRHAIASEADAAAWREVRLAGLCPAGTAVIRLTLQRTGEVEVAFRNVRVQFSPALETASE